MGSGISQVAVHSSMDSEIHPAVIELMRVKAPPQKSPEWYAIRDKMLTASDLAAAIGWNPYQSRKKLLRKKLGDQKYAFHGNAATKWGNDNEDIAAEEYSKKTGKKCLCFGLIAHPLHPWLGGSPDRVTTDGILVEIKCPMKRKITHECPKYYIPQVQILLEILNLEIAHFVQFSPATTWTEQVLDILEIRRDRDWFRKYFPVMQSFRNEWMEIDAKGGIDYLDKTGVFAASDSPSPTTSDTDSETKTPKKRKSVTLEEPFPFLDRDPIKEPSPPPSTPEATEVVHKDVQNFTFW